MLGEEKFIFEKGKPFEEIEDEYSSDEYEAHSEKMRKERDYVPVEYKIKCVKMAKAHPEWSLQTLQRKGCQLLKRKEYLARWEAEWKKGGTAIDKYYIIDSWTYENYLKARKKNLSVTTRNLRNWALAAAAQYPNFNFKASDGWMEKFKQRHRIRLGPSNDSTTCDTKKNNHR